MWLEIIIIGILIFVAGMLTGGALVTAADEDTITWKKEWDE